MLCLKKIVGLIGLSILLVCCTIIGSNSQYVYAQSSPYNLTTSYIVQYGDTLSAIAARYGIPVQEIATTNNIGNVNNIRIGQVLIIPSSHSATSPSTGQQSVPPTAVQPEPPSHQVAQQAPASPPAAIQPQPTNAQAGGAPSAEIYSEQASIYSASPQSSVQAQSQPPQQAPVQQPAQPITQPSGPAPMQSYSGCGANPGPSERTHSVRPGDTLYGIARTYGVTVNAVRQRNGLASDRIRVGECLIVPAGTTTTPVPDRRRSSEQPAATDTPVIEPTHTPSQVGQSHG